MEFPLNEKTFFCILSIIIFTIFTGCKTSKPRLNSISDEKMLQLISEENTTNTVLNVSTKDIIVPKTDIGTYRIAALDMLEIEVFQEPELSKQFKVTPNGTINYPLLGTVTVTNLTAQEAEAKITGLLAENYLVDPRVNVIVASTASRRVNIFGEVKKPGTYSISTDEPFTLLSTLSKAGGFTDIADIKKVRIVRRNGSSEKIIKVNVNNLINGKKGIKDIRLKNGDIITVPETWL